MNQENQVKLLTLSFIIYVTKYAPLVKHSIADLPQE